MLHHLTSRRMMLEDWFHTLPASWQALIGSGYLAVGTFFVLSGFVLARSYGTTHWNRASLIRYGMGRLARVYPAYLLSLLLVTPFASDFFLHSQRGFEAKAAVAASYGLVLQGWAKPEVFWNTPAWSLSCEFFFYLCFPIFAILLRRAGPIKLTIATAIALVFPLLLIRLNVPDARKPFYHLADFVVGIAANAIFDVIRRRVRNPRFCGMLISGGAALLTCAFIAFPVLLAELLPLPTALRPLNAALLIGLALGGGLPARLLSTNLALVLGKASYSMYILHIPLLWWYGRTWFNVTLPRPASACVFTAGVIAISIAVSRYLEEPANRWIRSACERFATTE